LDEANAPLPDIELKTNNNITDINVSIQEIKSHKIQNNDLLPSSPMNLKCYYKFLITDVLLNA
jgi:hypothetical protein